MGLTNNSTGRGAVDLGLHIKKLHEADKIVALAGNPNVGKSTVFNALTGMNQHTGNWPGKTVSNAYGYCTYNEKNFVMVDIPGTYSLMAHSAEEEVARNFICFGNPDAVIVVCDATCLERNMNLVLQTMEITDNVVVCINLMDEAKKKNITIDLAGISRQLGVPVVGTSARSKAGLDTVMQQISDLLAGDARQIPMEIRYIKAIEDAIDILKPAILDKIGNQINARWLSLKLLDYDKSLIDALSDFLGYNILSDTYIAEALQQAKKCIHDAGISDDQLRDKIVACLVLTAEGICSDTVAYDQQSYNEKDRKLDKIFTSKSTGFPIMILLMAGILWLTITGANYPSRLLSEMFFEIEGKLLEFCIWVGMPKFLYEMLVFGLFRVLSWVIAVMLPPMAIFFPLFTFLEDLGYLPRVAFNLDKCFKKCSACGKQALTMCMGFGCNATGVVGCRIIDSPRERLIAIITNNFVPCNGRFPTLIAIITMFFVGTQTGMLQSFQSTLLLTGFIILGVLLTFLVSKLLSMTILKGIPSSFTLELPPYRKPRLGHILVHSLFDRTLFVLGRAIVVAAPAGIIIWLMANVSVGDLTILAHCAAFLDPFARFLGMDGIILLAFIMGFPANEIVVPIMIMAYTATGSLVEISDLAQLRTLLVANGWTWVTAICTMLFSLLHWPCSTTCLTIKKETQSVKWTAVAFLLPTFMGMLVCFLFATFAKVFF